MPDWVQHSQNFRGFLRRWGLGSINLLDLLTGVLPVSIVQRNWQDDELDMWAAQTVGLIGANLAGCSALVAGSSTSQSTRAVLVRRIEAILFYNTALSGRFTFECERSWGFRLYTPEGAYANPPDNGGLGTTPSFFLPGLFASRSFSGPTALPFFGTDGTLVPVSTFVPPQHRQPFTPVFTGQTQGVLAAALCNLNPCPGCGVNSGLQPNGAILQNTSLFTYFFPRAVRILDFDDPPLRLTADQLVCVQANFLNTTGAQLGMEVNWYWQEIPTEGL